MTKSLAVVGLGNMGVSVLGACLEKGLSCVAVDIDEKKVAVLAKGHTVVPEQGAEEIFLKAVSDGRLKASTRLADVREADAIFVGVQTPAKETDCDYHVLKVVLQDLCKVCAPSQILIIGSTVFPGAIKRELLPILESRPDLVFVYEPVFLRAGFGISDYQRPGKLVLGVADPSRPDPRLVDLIDRVVEVPPRFVHFEEAEWIKMVHNAWMCTKISFANEIGALCREYGTNPEAVIDIAFSESRFGRLMTTSHMIPGPPYSGPCLPKDAVILGGMIAASRHFEWFDMGVTRALRTSNEKYRRDIVNRWLHLGLGSGMPLGIIGVAFRPEFNEIRDSLALDFLRAAEQANAKVIAYDPMFEGIDAARFELAARQDLYVSSLHPIVSHRLEEVWGSCGAVLLNRGLNEVERKRIGAVAGGPSHVIDLYDNKLQTGRQW